MVVYVLRRLFLLIPVLVGVSVVSFALLQLVPGDPALILAGEEATEEVLVRIRQDYGLNRWLPSGGTGTLAHLLLPALVLGAASSAVIARTARASMLEVLRQDYVRTARAKGVSDRLVVYRHALGNAMIPILTVFGLEFGYN